MLKRLFKGRDRLADPDPAVRRQALRDLDPAAAGAQTATLARLVRHDPDPGVRLAALAVLGDPEVLRSLLDDPQLPAATAAGIADRIVTLTPDTAPDPVRDHPLLLQKRVLALTPAQAGAAFTEITDPQALLALLFDAGPELRAVLLQQPSLRRPENLAALERRSRNRDKSLNRHARTELERCKSLGQQLDAERERAEELAAALQRERPQTSVQVTYDRQRQLYRRLEDTVARHREIREALLEFGEQPEDLGALLERAPRPAPIVTAIASVTAATGSVAEAKSVPQSADDQSADVESTDDQSAASSAPGPEPAVAEPEPAADPFAPLIPHLHALDQALTAGALPATLGDHFRRLTAAWEAETQQHTPAAPQAEVFRSVTERHHALAEALQRLDATAPPPPDEAAIAGDWPATLPESADQQRALGDSITGLQRRQQALEAWLRQIAWPRWATTDPRIDAVSVRLDRIAGALERAAGLRREAAQRLDTLLDELDAAVDRGALDVANGLLNQARALHDALPDATGHAAVDTTSGAANNTRGNATGNRLRQQAARLAELKDWRTFATAPKREALCDAMEALHQTPLEPRQQAERINELRQEWQALGPWARAADARLAERFNAAADRAFEPCRAYFAEQSAIRQANLQQRQQICEQLAGYLENTDWAQADMRIAERIMRTAREEWRRFHPVDRNAGKPLEARFEALQEQLHQRVKAAWERNIRAKEALIAEARELVEGAGSADAAQITDAAGTVALDETAWAERIDRIKQLQQRWRTVGATPHAPDQRLWQAFRALCDQLFAAREQSRQTAVEATQTRVHDARRLLDDFEALLGERDATTATARELQEFRQRAERLEALPSQHRRPLTERRTQLEERYQQFLREQGRARQRDRLQQYRHWDEAFSRAEQRLRGGGGAPEGAAETELTAPDPLFMERIQSQDAPVPWDALRRLTVRAELAAGIRPPDADEPLRLEVQVERLKQGLSGAGSGEEPRTLAETWCRLGPKDERADTLRQRFFDALGRL